MADRPYVVVSCCVSLDGYLDDASGSRLVLSSPEDLARVDTLRAGCDAILVGAGTVRRDNPRLVPSGHTPLKVTVTRTGDLDPGAAFFTTGDGPKLVYGPAALRERLGERAEVVEMTDLSDVCADLAARGIGRLLVEGGRFVLTQFLTGGAVDELQLAVAPVFVGDSRAPRFVGDGRFPWTAPTRARLLSASTWGDTAVLRYRLTEETR